MEVDSGLSSWRGQMTEDSHGKLLRTLGTNLNTLEEMREANALQIIPAQERQARPCAFIIWEQSHSSAALEGGIDYVIIF